MAPTTLAIRMEFSAGTATPVRDFFRKMGDKLLLVPKKPTEKYPNEFKYHLDSLKDGAGELKRGIVRNLEVATLDYRGKNIDPYHGIEGCTTSEVVDPDRSMPQRIAFAIGARAISVIPSAMVAFMPQLFGALSAAAFSIGLGINKLRQLRTELKIAKIEGQKEEPK